MSGANDTKGARVLIVEDDAFLAFEMAERLGRAGFEVVGPAAAVAEALNLLAQSGCNAAVLDIHLGRRETSEPIALVLKSRGLPFVTVTGYSHDQRSPAFDGAPVLSKPLRAKDLIAALCQCLKPATDG